PRAQVCQEIRIVGGLCGDDSTRAVPISAAGVEAELELVGDVGEASALDNHVISAEIEPAGPSVRAAGECENRSNQNRARAMRRGGRDRNAAGAGDVQGSKIAHQNSTAG